MIILTEEEVKRIIPPEKVQRIIEVVERGFFDYAQGNIQMPAKKYLSFEEYQGDLRIMPCYSSILKIAGTKIVNVHPENPKRGLPTVGAVVILNDARDGQPLAFMGASWLTDVRTGAGGAVAVKYLARKSAQTLGVVGAGQQAFSQILAINKVRNIKEVFVYDRTGRRFEKLAKTLGELGIKIKKASLEEAAQKDILVTVTSARTPVIKNEWILPGTHINAIGADAVGKEELEPEILKRAKIVVDNWEQASHSGEINVPLREGIIQKENICAELGEIVIKKKAGRENEKEITVFDSTGLALQDLYTAHLVYNLLLNKLHRFKCKEI